MTSDPISFELDQELRQLRKIRHHYLGALGLLARTSVAIRSTQEETADELREDIDHALDDGAELIPGLKVRRIINRRELDIEPDPEGDPA